MGIINTSLFAFPDDAPFLADWLEDFGLTAFASLVRYAGAGAHDDTGRYFCRTIYHWKFRLATSGIGDLAVVATKNGQTYRLPICGASDSGWFTLGGECVDPPAMVERGLKRFAAYAQRFYDAAQKVTKEEESCLIS